MRQWSLAAEIKEPPRLGCSLLISPRLRLSTVEGYLRMTTTTLLYHGFITWVTI